MTTTSISNNPDKKILLDGDVISHFIKGELFDLLGKLYQGRLSILDIVKAEVKQRPGWDVLIERLIVQYNIEEINFPESLEYIKEYAHLISQNGHVLGRGERYSSKLRLNVILILSGKTFERVLAGFINCGKAYEYFTSS